MVNLLFVPQQLLLFDFQMLLLLLQALILVASGVLLMIEKVVIREADCLLYTVMQQLLQGYILRVERQMLFLKSDILLSMF